MLAFLYAPALLLIYYLVVWFLHGRDPKPGPVVPRYTPPPGLTPAAARYLQLNGTDGRSLAALLVDLALRKRITIEPTFLARILRQRLQNHPPERHRTHLPGSDAL